MSDKKVNCALPREEFLSLLPFPSWRKHAGLCEMRAAQGRRAGQVRRGKKMRVFHHTTTTPLETANLPDG